MKADAGVAAGALLFGALLFLGLFLVSATARDQRGARLDRQIFLVAIVLRFAASVALYGLGLVRLIGDEDASGWTAAFSLISEWERQGVTLFDLPGVWVATLLHPRGNLGYQYMVSTLFYVSGSRSRLVAAVLNNFFGAMTVVLTARVGASIFSSWVGSRVGWYACFFPSLVLWSAQTLKEPIVIFLETLALYACVLLRGSRGSLRHVVICSAAIVLLVSFRFYAAYVTGVVILLTLALPQLRSGRTRFGAALAVGALVVPLLVLTGALARHEATVQMFDLARLQDIRDWTARHTGSGVPLDYDIQTPSGMLMSVAVGGVHLLLAPFPWQLGGAGLRTLLTLPELLVWWWLVFTALVPGLRIALRHRFTDVQPLLYFVLGMAFLYGLTFSNVGLVFRQRAQLLPWLLVFAMVGLEQRAVRSLLGHQARRLKAVSFRRPVTVGRAQS